MLSSQYENTPSSSLNKPSKYAVLKGGTLQWNAKGLYKTNLCDRNPTD